MIHSSEKITIEESISSDGIHTLKFSFKGKFTAVAARFGANVWAEVFDKNPLVSYKIIWDCARMEGFELDARKEWYTRLSQYKRRIMHVTTISSSLMIRSAAKVMLEFFGIPSSIQKPVSKPVSTLVPGKI